MPLSREQACTGQGVGTRSFQMNLIFTFGHLLKAPEAGSKPPRLAASVQRRVSHWGRFFEPGITGNQSYAWV
jgi:hypothetical protein